MHAMHMHTLENTTHGYEALFLSFSFPGSLPQYLVVRSLRCHQRLTALVAHESVLPLNCRCHTNTSDTLPPYFIVIKYSTHIHGSIYNSL